MLSLLTLACVSWLATRSLRLTGGPHANFLNVLIFFLYSYAPRFFPKGRCFLYLYILYLFYVRSMLLRALLHPALSNTSTPNSCFSLKSSLIHPILLHFGLPPFSYSVHSSTSLFPLHKSLLFTSRSWLMAHEVFSCTFFVVSITFIVPFILSLLTASISVTWHTHLSIFISATSNCYIQLCSLNWPCFSSIRHFFSYYRLVYSSSNPCVECTITQRSRHLSPFLPSS